MFRTIDAVMPIVLDRERERRDDRRLYVTGVLKPGVTREQAEADLAASHASCRPTTRSPTQKPASSCGRSSSCSAPTSTPSCILLSLDRGHRVLHRVRERLEHHPRAGATRRRELAVRAALGAGRLQQIRQFMIESLVTSSAAGAVGLFLAWWGLVAIRFASADIDGFSEMSLNGRVLAVSIALTLARAAGLRAAAGVAHVAARYGRAAPGQSRRRVDEKAAGCANHSSSRRWRWRSS